MLGTIMLGHSVMDVDQEASARFCGDSRIQPSRYCDTDNLIGKGIHGHFNRYSYKV